MLHDPTSTLISGLVSTSSSTSSRFPPQSCSFNRKWAKSQTHSRRRRSTLPLRKKEKKKWDYFSFIIRPVSAMLTVLLCSEPVTFPFDPILSVCSQVMARKHTNTWPQTTGNEKKKATIRKRDMTSRARYHQYRSQKGGRLRRASLGNSDAPVSACDTLVSTSNCTWTEGKVH